MATLTTPRMSLPYPDGAERVMDGDNAIGALAAAIDSPLYRADFPVYSGASAAASAPVAANGRIALETITGNAANLVANALRIAPGMAGIYLCAFGGSADKGTAGSAARVVLRQTGNTRAGVQPAIHAVNSVRWSMVAIVNAVVGDDLYAECTDAWSHQAFNFQILRLGVGFGAFATTFPSGLDEEELEPLPAP